jgi:hypothetical protein
LLIPRYEPDKIPIEVITASSYPPEEDNASYFSAEECNNVSYCNPELYDGSFYSPDRYSYVLRIGDVVIKISECETEILNHLNQYERPDLYGYSELHQAIDNFVTE